MSECVQVLALIDASHTFVIMIWIFLKKNQDFDELASTHWAGEARWKAQRSVDAHCMPTHVCCSRMRSSCMIHTDLRSAPFFKILAVVHF